MTWMELAKKDKEIMAAMRPLLPEGVVFTIIFGEPKLHKMHAFISDNCSVGNAISLCEQGAENMRQQIMESN